MRCVSAEVTRGTQSVLRGIPTLRVGMRQSARVSSQANRSKDRPVRSEKPLEHLSRISKLDAESPLRGPHVV